VAGKQHEPSEADALTGVLAQIMTREEWLEEISWYRQMVADTQALKPDGTARADNGASAVEPRALTSARRPSRPPPARRSRKPTRIP
jgi:hypothetical protein